MKRFLARAGAKVGRFFWSWGFLKFILWTITLIVFLYVEEDWRGARAWAATKAKWEAKGETFDLNRFIPPPIPDDQNLAAIPLFRLDPPAKDAGFHEPLVLQKAMRQSLPGGGLPIIVRWQRGQSIDRKKFEDVIAADYMAAFNAKPAGDALAQFNALYPFVSDLLAASAQRPLCRLPGEYAFLPPDGRALGLVVAGLRLSKILTLHAVLSLSHDQSDLAVEDVKAHYKMVSGVARDPSLVGGLVSIGMTAINNEVIYSGLTQHAWSDVQLAELEHILGAIDFLAVFQFDIKSEAATSVTNIDYFKEFQPRLLTTPEGHGTRSLLPLPVGLFRVPWPAGWWDENKSQTVNFLFGGLAIVDQKSRRVFTPVSIDLMHQNEREEYQWFAWAPWNIWFITASPPLRNLMIKYAFGQVRIDETRIACALERYHLAHGIYPESLDELAPACIDAVPHDIMNGESYRYRFRPDGTFLLYSVGWNQTDDGGVAIYTDPDHNGHPSQDYEHGDWVWPTPK